MILYTLACVADHRFDSWFPSSSAFDIQSAAGLVTCPACGSPEVGKTIMAPAVVGGRQEQLVALPQTVPATTDIALLDEERQQIRKRVKAFRDTVLAEAQDVGARFPEEARRMHEGEIPSRQIRGHATPHEARDLIEDGILILPLPSLPDELN